MDDLQRHVATDLSGFLAGLSEPAAVRALEQAGGSVRLVQGAGGSIFHPKYYGSRWADGRISAAVGSANLTEGGLGRNTELLLVLSDLIDACGWACGRTWSALDAAGSGALHALPALP